MIIKFKLFCTVLLLRILSFPFTAPSPSLLPTPVAICFFILCLIADYSCFDVFCVGICKFLWCHTYSSNFHPDLLSIDIYFHQWFVIYRLNLPFLVVITLPLPPSLIPYVFAYLLMCTVVLFYSDKLQLCALFSHSCGIVLP